MLTQGQPGSLEGAPRLNRPRAKNERKSKKHKERKEGDKAMRLATLREERAQREVAEAARARALLFASQEEAGAARGGKRYHGAFRAPLPRRPHAAGRVPRC